MSRKAGEENLSALDSGARLPGAGPHQRGKKWGKRKRGLKVRVREVMDQECAGSAPRALLGALSLAAAGYRLALGLRGWAYRCGFRRSRCAPLPVLSVGNLTAGGTGKTPFVEMLARRLHAAGRRPAVICRGYGAEAPGAPNDEALLLRQLLPPAVPVLCRPDRLAGCRQAAREGSDVAILDDGFQHLRLQRDLDLVLLDATNPFGYGRLLPRGLLREPKRALARAEIVVVTRADQVSGEKLADVAGQIERYAPQAAVVRCRHRPRGLCRLGSSGDPGEATLPPEALSGRRLAGLCAIGNPDAFDATLRGLGACLVFSRHFADHHRFSATELGKAAKEAREAGAELIITTHKDAVKVPPGFSWPLPAYYLKVESEILEGEAALWARVGEAIVGFPAPPQEEQIP